MSDRIPTTDEVRDAAMNSGHWEEQILPAEFDRWLDEVKAQEHERIRLNIIDRVSDLRSCTKNDNCQEFSELIASYIEEWIGGKTE